MAAEANRGSKLVAITALVVAAILAYYYWTETNISRELFERMEKMQSELIRANQTIKDRQIAIDTQMVQQKKLEEENKKVVEEKKKVDEALVAKTKEAADNAQKLVTENKAAEEKLAQSQKDCSASCEARISKAVEECKRSSTAPPRGLLW